MSPFYRAQLALVFALLLSACRATDTETPPATDAPGSSDAASAYGSGEIPTDAEVEATRYAGRGRSTSIDTAAIAAAARSNPERLTQIDSTANWSAPIHLPLGGDVAGPSVVKAQALLDRAGFSPGEIDGRWGDNSELAVVWFQQAASLPVTGLIDEATLRALMGRAGNPSALVAEATLTADDVEGPFETLPTDVYERAELEGQGFESLGEALGEKYHASPALLQRLNPGVSLDSLSAGARLRVPNVAGAPRSRDAVARLVVSGRDGYLHALADDGTIVFHAPVTLGADYDPSPEGSFTVRSVTENPSWHYQPSILANVPDDRPEATLPPGPNNAVGVVWMALSEPHYGIHGTSAPSTIGTATSSGCVRLTNWDAERLTTMVRAGTSVRFRDVVGRSSGRDSTAA